MKAYVRNGRLVLDEPTDLPDGTEVDLLPIVDDLHDVTAEDRAEINAVLQESVAQVSAGRFHTSAELLAELRKIR